MRETDAYMATNVSHSEKDRERKERERERGRERGKERGRTGIGGRELGASNWGQDLGQGTGGQGSEGGMPSSCNAAQSIKAFGWIVCTVYGRRTSSSLVQCTKLNPNFSAVDSAESKAIRLPSPASMEEKIAVLSQK